MAQQNAHLLETVALSCARDGIGFLRMSVDLGPAFFAARNSQQATALLDFTLEECAIIVDDMNGYNNSHPNPAAVVRILRTAPAAAPLRAAALLGPAAAAAAAAAAAGAGGAGVGGGGAAAGAAGATTLVVSCNSTIVPLTVMVANSWFHFLTHCVLHCV
jgi:hypothetical protein